MDEERIRMGIQMIFPEREVILIDEGKIEIKTFGYIDKLKVIYRWKRTLFGFKIKEIKERIFMEKFILELKLKSFIDQYVLRKKWCSYHGYSCDGTRTIYPFKRKSYTRKCDAKKYDKPQECKSW